MLGGGGSVGEPVRGSDGESVGEPVRGSGGESVGEPVPGLAGGSVGEPVPGLTSEPLTDAVGRPRSGVAWPRRQIARRPDRGQPKWQVLAARLNAGEWMSIVLGTSRNRLLPRPSMIE